MYADGHGIAHDDVAAVSWFLKAADQGYLDAEYPLGIMYADGQGVAHDDAAAASWFRRAADQGKAKAQYNLGSCTPTATVSRTTCSGIIATTSQGTSITCWRSRTAMESGDI
jgi:Sel1 repeat